MGFPMREAAGRAALIVVMLGGGLLYAGISQAQDVATDAQAERSAELVAAAGGPAAAAHLIPFDADKAAVEVRDEDVADATPAAATSNAPPVQANIGERSPVRRVAVASATPSTR